MAKTKKPRPIKAAPKKKTRKKSAKPQTVKQITITLKKIEKSEEKLPSPIVDLMTKEMCLAGDEQRYSDFGFGDQAF